MTRITEYLSKLRRKWTNPTATQQPDDAPPSPPPANEEEQLVQDGRQAELQAHDRHGRPQLSLPRQMSAVKGDNNSSNNPTKRGVNGFGSNSALRRPQDKLAPGKRSTDTRRDSRHQSDEDRLLGSNKPDPDAVFIVPGSIGRNRPAPGKQFENFRPGSSIGSQPNKRQNQNDRYQGEVSRICRSNFGFGELDGNENNDSPRKRQKKDMRKNFDRFVDSEDSRPTAVHPSGSRSASLAGSSNPGSFAPPLFSSRPSTFKTDEHGETEDAIQWRSKKRARLSGPNIENEEAFTAGSRAKRSEDRAKQTHRTRTIDVDNLDSGHGKGAFIAVEIPTGKGDQSSNRDESRLADQFVSTNGQRRNADRDSPDVLQGDTTVSEYWKANGRRSASPGRIQKTNFSSTKKMTGASGKASYKQPNKPNASFPIEMFHCGPVVVEQPCSLITKGASGSVFCPSELPAVSFDVHRASRILWGMEPSTKVAILFPNSDPPTAPVDVTFASPKASSEFCQLAQRYGAKIVGRYPDWMDKAFERQDRHPRSTSMKESPPIEQKTPLYQNKLPKRQRIVEQLDDHPTVEHERSAPAISTSERQSNRLSSRPSLSHSHPSPERGDGGIPIPVKKYGGNPIRETRSRAQQQTMHIDSDRESETPLSPIREKASGWSKPLVYPRMGKKKAEVEAHDLERLRDSEFLNDNLIGFYLRFLEHHLERTSQDLSKRVYFFNSYFFASLTNTARGKKGINYEAVQKWTRAVDIFDRDYVVVPINENAHWYIVIICNLRSLLREENDEEESMSDKKDTLQDDDDDKVKDGVIDATERDNLATDRPGSEGTNHGEPMSENGRDQQLRGSFGSLTLSDRELKKQSKAGERVGVTSSSNDSDPEKDDWPDEDENRKAPWSGFQPSSQSAEKPESHHSTPSRGETSKPRPSKKKNRPSLQKYDADQPTIITFDSLGCSRFPTIRILKDYLEQEGESKKGLKIDTSRIKGMTAKEIPQQPNYWDCGLYLLAYMEKFVQDPDEFIRKLLRREMSGRIDWPPMKSKILRRRLRDFLFALYEEQDKMEKESEGMKLMVDAKPLRILLPDEESMPMEQARRSDSDKARSESKQDSGRQWPIRGAGELRRPRSPRERHPNETAPFSTQTPGRQAEPEVQSKEKRSTTPKLHKSPGTPLRDRAETRSSPRHQRKEKPHRRPSADEDIVDRSPQETHTPLLHGIQQYSDMPDPTDPKRRPAGKRESVVEIPGTPPASVKDTDSHIVVEASPKGSPTTPYKKTRRSDKDNVAVVV